jgi:hypothetical protein
MCEPSRHGSTDALSAPVPESDSDFAPESQGVHMDKWKIIKDSKIAQIGASAGTVIAVAAIVGAGFKWGW